MRFLNNRLLQFGTLVAVAALIWMYRPIDKSVYLPYRYANGKWGFINQHGDTLIEPMYDQITWSYDGPNVNAEDMMACERDGFVRLIDRAGNRIDKLNYIQIRPFDSTGLAIAWRDGFGFGWIDRTGKEVIPCQYMVGRKTESDDLFGVSHAVSGKLGIINRAEEIVVPLQYDYVRVSPEGNFFAAELNRRVTMIDRAGNKIFPDSFDEIVGIDEHGLAVAKKAGRYGVISTNGSIIFPFEWDAFTAFDKFSGLARVARNGNVGLMDRSGKPTTPVNFGNISNIDHGTDLFPARTKAVSGYVDRTGQTKIPFIYDRCEPFDAFGFALVGKEGLHGLIDRKGTLVVPMQYQIAYSLNHSNLYYFGLNGYTKVIDARKLPGATVPRSFKPTYCVAQIPLQVKPRSSNASIPLEEFRRWIRMITRQPDDLYDCLAIDPEGNIIRSHYDWRFRLPTFSLIAGGMLITLGICQSLRQSTTRVST